MSNYSPDTSKKYPDKSGLLNGTPGKSSERQF